MTFPLGQDRYSRYAELTVSVSPAQATPQEGSSTAMLWDFCTARGSSTTSSPSAS